MHFCSREPCPPGIAVRPASCGTDAMHIGFDNEKNPADKEE